MRRFVLLHRTLSEHHFPQFPQTLQYLYKLSVEGLRMSDNSIVTITFLMEVSLTGRPSNQVLSPAPTQP